MRISMTGRKIQFALFLSAMTAALSSASAVELRASFSAVAMYQDRLLVAVSADQKEASRHSVLRLMNLNSGKSERVDLPKELLDQNIVGLWLGADKALVVLQSIDRAESDPSVLTLDFTSKAWTKPSTVKNCSSFKNLSLKDHTVIFDCETVTDKGTYQTRLTPVDLGQGTIQFGKSTKLKIPSHQQKSGGKEVSLAGQWPDLNELLIKQKGKAQQKLLPKDFLD